MKRPSPRRAASGAVLATALLALWAMPVAAQSPPAASSSPSSTQAQQFTLANGMTLIVQPDRRAPTAVQMIWVRVGSMDEVDGTSGVAHALEHMMFKGTKDLKPGEFSRRVAALGGRENAFTTRDYTGYYQQIPMGKLEDIMKLESDRFAHNQWADDEFKREIEVVKEERRMRTEDQPRALLGEQQTAAVFVASPYHRPVVGWMSDLDAMMPQDVREFHQRWYVPANAAIVIAGDVDVAQVRKLAEKYYGGIPNRAVPPRKPRTEPEQRGIRRIEFKAPAEQSYVSLAFRTPKLETLDGESDAWALVVLSAVLDGYAGSRLDRALTQGPDRVADSAGSYSGFIGRGPQLFGLDGVPAAGKTPEQVEAALRAEVARVAKEGIGAAELARVKTQWVASETYKLDSVMAQARELGSNWVQGLPLDASAKIIAKLQAVTAEQVQAVAARYFGDDQLTVAILRPLPPEKNRRPRGFAAPAGDLR
ncbi:M16 family metallopeptidase [Variovorax fucosicus]|uniref:M16 family metallopeptidase n=1 Tax=Variovorax fucosicus TaxID=3053517 RepID=UPI002578E2E6|nr:pitrilysin family protein [Variovorax sp. J22G47]MDM0054234.1 pitrilysin family protein [Variovorax sp. J22G47]